MNIQEKIQEKLFSTKYYLERAEKELEERTEHYKKWVQMADARDLITFSQSYFREMETVYNKIANLSNEQKELEYFLEENEK